MAMTGPTPRALVMIWCILSMPTVLHAQGREASPAESVVSVSYRVCLSPSRPIRIATSEAAQARIPECKRWSTLERVSKDLNPAQYAGATSESGPPVTAFLRDILPAIYKVSSPTYVTKQLYEGFRSFGWQEIRPTDERTGALIVWPGMAGIIISDSSRPEERSQKPLVGLTVLYPSQARGGQLSVVDAPTLQASLGGTVPPRLLIPTPPEKTVFWNTWAENLAGEFAPGHIVAVGGSYNIMLDFSRFDYARVAAVGPGHPDQGTKAYVDELVARYGALRFVATIVGRGLRFADNRSVQERTVRREQLENPPSAGRASNESISDFASRAGALSDSVNGAPHPVQLRVDAFEAGCAGVAFSIWNPSMTHLIDYVVRTIAIRRTDGVTLPCRLPTPDIAVRPDTPKLSLLSLEAFRATNASLHVFEREGSAKTSTVVVYLQDDLQLPYSWSIPVRLSDLERALMAYLEHADSKVYLRDIGGVISHHFFNADDDEDQDQASKALAAIKQLASRPAGQRTLFVRFENSASQLVFIPIQLLPLEGGGLLRAQVDVIHPLPPPIDLTAAASNCLDAFNFVISPDVARTLNAKSALDDIRTTLHFNVIDTWDGFVDYVGAPGRQPTTEALLLLAHHGPDAIAFDPAQHQPRVTSQTILRRFRPVSLVVLAACSVANISEADSGRQILARFNDRGVGAAVVSPFLVPGEVGARLIAAFAKGVVAARKSTEDITLGAVFRQAVSDVLDDKTGINDLDRLRVNEFMLVGNGDIRVCRKGS